MSIKDNLTNAIGAHGIWKSRLRTAITTKRMEFTVSVLKAEDQCEFGKWLLSSALAKDVQNGHGKTVRELHAEFHKVAAQVAELALAGKQKEAENQLTNEGAYGQASSKLTLALMNWKNAL